MKTISRYLPAALAATAIIFMTYASADVRVESIGGSEISLRGDDVVITARDGSEALITPDGALTIRGRPIQVTSDQRELLKQYSAGIADIEKRGMRIGKHAVDMVGGMMGTLVADLFAGHDQDMDKDMEAKAEPLKEEARALCGDVRVQKHLQQKLATALPMFKPYAVIDMDSENDCHVDNNN